jgi:hypothetical protein
LLKKVKIFVRQEFYTPSIKEEPEVARLTEIAANHKKQDRLLFFSLILILIAFFVAIRLFRLKKKTTETLLALITSEKNEAIRLSKLREEQLEKAKFEKYDVLLDGHFKRIQISEMDNELKELKSELQKLNVLIDDYSCKLSEHEKKKSQAIVFETRDTSHTSIFFDLYELIKKRIKDIAVQKEYIEKLTTIDDAFFQRLKKRAENKNLSVLDIKRCIALLIGMKASDIAECFSVEAHTIHQSSYRLKRKLKVDKDTDFNQLLKQLHLHE